ncbi:MAG: Gfo/Idh/MocA family protein [Granulosicoccus sp.]
MTELKVACAGAGYFSTFHYEAWARIENTCVVGSMAKEHVSPACQLLPGYSDLDVMLQETNPDILDIITPPVTHANFINKALEHNINTITCQKPFCTTLEEAQKIVADCQEAKTRLVIHENFRFQPWFRCIKQAIDEGLVGDLHQIVFRLRTGDGQGPDAYLDRQPYFQTMPRFLIHETGIHYIDTFRYLMGEPTAVYADLRTMNPAIKGEDAGYFIFDFDRDKRALFDGNRCLDHCADNQRTTLGECLVEGNKGSLTLYGDGSVHHRPFGHSDSKVLLAAQIWSGFAGDCVFNFQQHVVDALKGTTKLENSGQEYLRNLAVESALYLSAQKRMKIDI